MGARIAIDQSSIAEFCRRNRIVRLSLFGSVVRDDFDPHRSDVDVLVEFEPGRTPGFAFALLQDELSKLLGRRADLHTLGSLGERICKRVRIEEEVQYDATQHV